MTQRSLPGREALLLLNSANAGSASGFDLCGNYWFCQEFKLDVSFTAFAKMTTAELSNLCSFGEGGFCVWGILSTVGGERFCVWGLCPGAECPDTDEFMCIFTEQYDASAVYAIALYPSIRSSANSVFRLNVWSRKQRPVTPVFWVQIS